MSEPLARYEKPSSRYHIFIKDINDALIHQGDIVFCESANMKGDVWFEEGTLKTDCQGNGVEKIKGNLLEVIGNIYDNPEMVCDVIRL